MVPPPHTAILALVSIGTLLVPTPEGGWRPGVGDPTPIGWITVTAYLGAALLCRRASMADHSRKSGNTRLLWSWRIFALGMLALGINKQLDLQSLLTTVGRVVAERDGWYAERHVVKLWFVGGIATSAALAGTSIAWWTCHHLRELAVASAGSVFLALFVVMRAASFHHVDTLVLQCPPGPIVSAVLELTGIGCVGAGAAHYLRHWGSPSTTPETPRDD